MFTIIETTVETATHDTAAHTSNLSADISSRYSIKDSYQSVFHALVENNDLGGIDFLIADPEKRSTAASAEELMRKSLEQTFHVLRVANHLGLGYEKLDDEARERVDEVIDSCSRLNGDSGFAELIKAVQYEKEQAPAKSSSARQVQPYDDIGSRENMLEIKARNTAYTALARIMLEENKPEHDEWSSDGENDYSLYARLNTAAALHRYKGSDLTTLGHLAFALNDMGLCFGALQEALQDFVLDACENSYISPGKKSSILQAIQDQLNEGTEYGVEFSRTGITLVTPSGTSIELGYVGYNHPAADIKKMLAPLADDPKASASFRKSAAIAIEKLASGKEEGVRVIMYYLSSLQRYRYYEVMEDIAAELGVEKPYLEKLIGENSKKAEFTGLVIRYTDNPRDVMVNYRMLSELVAKQKAAGLPPSPPASGEEDGNDGSDGNADEYSEQRFIDIVREYAEFVFKEYGHVISNAGSGSEAGSISNSIGEDNIVTIDSIISDIVTMLEDVDVRKNFAGIIRQSDDPEETNAYGKVYLANASKQKELETKLRVYCRFPGMSPLYYADEEKTYAWVLDAYIADQHGAKSLDMISGMLRVSTSKHNKYYDGEKDVELESRLENGERYFKLTRENAHVFFAGEDPEKPDYCKKRGSEFLDEMFENAAGNQIIKTERRGKRFEFKPTNTLNGIIDEYAAEVAANYGKDLKMDATQIKSAILAKFETPEVFSYFERIIHKKGRGLSLYEGREDDLRVRLRAYCRIEGMEAAITDLSAKELKDNLDKDGQKKFNLVGRWVLLEHIAAHRGTPRYAFMPTIWGIAKGDKNRMYKNSDGNLSVQLPVKEVNCEKYFLINPVNANAFFQIGGERSKCMEDFLIDVFGDKDAIRKAEYDAKGWTLPKKDDAIVLPDFLAVKDAYTADDARKAGVSAEGFKQYRGQALDRYGSELREQGAVVSRGREMMVPSKRLSLFRGIMDVAIRQVVPPGLRLKESAEKGGKKRGRKKNIRI